MTVAVASNKVLYDGNGGTTVFAFAFPILAETDLRVVLRDTAGDETVKELTTDYTVSASPWTSGGSITMVTAPASGETLLIKREVAATQLVDYRNGDAFPAETHEAALDKLTYLVQQLLEGNTRAVTLQEVTELTGLTLPDPGANTVLYSPDGLTLLWGTLTTLSGSPIVTPVGLSDGGTGASTAAGARANLGENASGSFFTKKHNFSASTAPTVNEDTGDGYSVGSWWFDTTADKVYTCLDATAAAAVWHELIHTDSGPAFKNRVTNGDIVIDQRNSGSAITVNNNATFYGPDMWRGFGVAADGVFTLARSTATPPAGFTHFLRAAVTTADASIPASSGYLISTPFEGFDMLDLGFGAVGAQTITLSFRVRSSLTGTFSGALRNGAGTRSYPFSFDIDAANTWETKSITIAGDTSGTWPTDNTMWGLLQFDLGAGTSLRGSADAWVGSNIVGVTGAVSLISTLSATFDITGVQLEIGDTATEFERLSIGARAARCERYYQRMGEGNTVFPYVFGYNTAGNGVYNSVPFPTRMRATPTVTVAGTWAVSNCGQPTVSGVSDRGLVLVAVCTGTGPLLTNPNGTDDYLTFTAEL